MTVGTRFRAFALALLCAAAFAGPALAVDTEARFKDPVLEQRYQELIHEVRCLVCLNQTIADSTAPLAGDLRRNVHEMVAAGKSEKEIADFLIARYGDFVMYKPPLQPSTYILWGSPFILLVIGGVIFARILRNRSAQPLDEDPAA